MNSAVPSDNCLTTPTFFGSQFAPMQKLLPAAMRKMRFFVAVLLLVSIGGNRAYSQITSVKGNANAAAPSTSVKPAPVGHRSVIGAKWKGDQLFHGYKPDQEVLEKRDQFSKHFRMADGKINAVISQAAVHYRKDDSSPWEDIGVDIRPNTTGVYSQYELAVPDNEYQLYFSRSVNKGYLVHFQSGDIQLGVNNKMSLVSPTGEVSNSYSANNVTGASDDNTITYSGTYPFASDVNTVRSNGVDHDIILNEKPSFINDQNSTSSLVCSEFIKLPQGWKIIPRGEFNCSGCREVANPGHGLVVVDGNGKRMADILDPVIKEKNSRNTPTSSTFEKITGSFKVESVNGGVVLNTYVPAAWLNDPGRIYPVVIDPSINCSEITTNYYTGIQKSSGTCYAGYNTDGDFWTYEPAGYPDGWTYFATSSIGSTATVDQVTIYYYNDGSSADVLNFRSMATYTDYPNCSTLWGYETGGTVYATDPASDETLGYDFAVLGSTATTDLQSRIASNYFGVAAQITSGYKYLIGYYYGTSYAPYLVVIYDQCYNTTNGYGNSDNTITPGCTSASQAMASTMYTAWSATAGVQYNFSLSGATWSAGNYMTVYDNNGTNWVPLANGVNSLSITPSSSGTLRLGVYNGSGCVPAWPSGSATLTYQIAPPGGTLANSSNVSNGHLCQGSYDDFTLTNIVGSETWYYDWTVSNTRRHRWMDQLGPGRR